MSLKVDIDLADALVDEKPFAVGIFPGHTDPGEFGFSRVWALPGGRGTTLYPDQIRSDWGTSTAVTKWALSDWNLDTSRWEQIQKRGAGDWFLGSRGRASALDGTGVPTGAAIPIVSKATLPENAPLYVEVFGYGVPGTRVPDLLQVTFGGGLVLHIHSDGHADLEDQRRGSIAFGTYLSKGQSLTRSSVFPDSQSAHTSDAATSLMGKSLGIVIFPYRRGRLLIVTDQGGAFEVSVGARTDATDATDAYSARRTQGQDVYFITTDAGPVTLTPSPAVRALVAANPLTCSQALLETPNGALTSPVVNLPYDVGTGPSQILGDADAQDGASLSLSVLNPDLSTFAPTTAARASTLVYQVLFSSPSPGVFPILYSLEMKWDRVMGTKTYGTTTVPTTRTVTGNVISGRMSLSRDRSQKSAEVVIDNPSDYYTSLKDLWNRPILISFTPSGVDVPFGIPAGDVLPVFLGLTDPVDFTDGVTSRLTVRASGLRKRLRSSLMNDSQKFDGMFDTAVVRQLLHDEGIPDTQIVIFDEGGTALDSADPGDDPLWQPSNGMSKDEFIQHLADTFSGWVWDDIGGIYYYVPKEYFTSVALVQNGGVVPQVYTTTPYTSSVAATRAPNSGALVALDGSVKQTAEEPRANDFWVLGQDDEGNIITAHYEDWGSIHDRTAANYVGERRTLIYASGSITTQGAAQVTLGALLPAFSQAVVSVSFTLPDYQITQIPLDGPVQLEGYAIGLITGLEADLTNDRSRRTEYTYEVLQ